MKQVFLFATVFLCLSGCREVTSEEDLEAWLGQQSGIIEDVISDPEQYRPQILYTRIERDSLGKPQFFSQHFRVDSREYFYPASTVKLPVAVFALEKCRELGIDPETIMITDSVRSWQSPASADTSAASGLPSVAHYIKKIFLVSDNDAFNRLYEFVGPAYIHHRMAELGLDHTRIVHRLSISLSPRQNQMLNPIHFLSGQGDTLLSLPERMDSLPPKGHQPVLLGQGEMIGGELHMGGKDFSDKNCFPLDEQQAFLRAICFPDAPGGNLLHIDSTDREFLLRYMRMLPHESRHPAYDRSIYYDSYVKFLMFGDSTDPIPEHIQVFNKVGNAYGWLIDNAWIVNRRTGEEWLLSVCVWVNDNRIFNDDVYEYDTIGYPFLGELGRKLILK